jgi:DnaK suppressor protein
VSDSKNNLAAIKKQLLERKMELEQQLIQLSRERITDDQVQDPGDQALTSTMESLRSSLQSAETEEYRRTVRALDKLEDGSYGVCMDCGQNISDKRLKSYPDAARCLVCQEAYEERS